MGKGPKKRPSVETEGRLTIACHMKILVEMSGEKGNRRLKGYSIKYKSHTSIIPASIQKYGKKREKYILISVFITIYKHYDNV
jgi:hypothetical protein